MAELSRLSRSLQPSDRAYTLLGIGPMSRTVVDVALRCALEQEAPLVFVASRNQIESRQLGGGYVEGWDQRAFSRYTMRRARQLGVEGVCVLGRDHGGPWQRDEEYRASLDWDAALEHALVSYADDVQAGFTCLHVDTSRDPRFPGAVPLDLAVERVVQIMARTEVMREQAGGGPLDYEVSLEETAASSSPEQEFGYFVETLTRMLERANLPQPHFIVGNTGALVRMDGNVGYLNFNSIERLRAIAEKHGMILKEHNADYLSDADLVRHPAARIGMANVAPELGHVETGALLELCRREEAALGRTHPDRSRLRDVLLRHIRRSERWRKWLAEPDDGHVPTGQGEPEDRLLRIAGHYFFQQPDVRAARAQLYDNCTQVMGDQEAHGFVESQIAAAICRYLRAFALTARVSPEDRPLPAASSRDGSP